ncbi:hypothetical protein FRC10_008771 [Ceratobasidium sp. 414]|nr:hypothetical protein FRC10_008771 [Ceratobasidium sp. 414]
MYRQHPRKIHEWHRFDSDQLRAYMKKLLASTLQGAVWDGKDRDKTKAWCKEIGERVKDRMLEIEPNGFKFLVTAQINENLGQGGRANMTCHWEDSDAMAQEMFVNSDLRLDILALLRSLWII